MIRLIQWNVTSAKKGWFPIPWEDRKDGIGEVLTSLDADIIACNETHFSFQTADILEALGCEWCHISSPVGNDLFYRWQLFRSHEAEEYPLYVQGRALMIAQLNYRDHAGYFVVANTHLPYNSLSLRTSAAKKVVSKIWEVPPYVDVLTGDMNAASRSVGPLRVFAKAGWKRADQQVKGLGMVEYPKKGKRLSHLLTRRAKMRAARLVYTHPKLSDHRPTVYDINQF